MNHLHLNTTGPKSGELLALFGSLFIFVCFEALLGYTGHFTSTQRTLQWPCAPRETILQTVQRVLHEDCVIFLQGAQLGMASKPHTGPSNEKSWDSQPFSELDWRMGLQTERSMSVPNCHVNMLAILRSNQHVWIALMYLNVFLHMFIKLGLTPCFECQGLAIPCSAADCCSQLLNGAGIWWEIGI